MKNILKICIVQLLFLSSNGIYAQVGIGTIEPDASSMLDIASESKGFLMPRLTTLQRNAIVLPANGLMIYNTSLNDGQINIGSAALPNWLGIKGQEGPSPTIETFSFGDDVVTSSLVPVSVPGMSATPSTGAYLVLFNGQINSVQNFDSAVGALDVVDLYNQVMALPGGVSHTLVFGNGEVLLPGVYNVSGAPSISGTITLDGQGDPNSLFVVRGTGAFTTGVGSNVSLINGAVPCNIIWVSEGAMSTGANSNIKGTFIANNAAIALGANTTLKGSLFSTIGAITMGDGSILSDCPAASQLDYGSLSSFVMWTASGGISGCPTCYVTGNVGTGSGAATGFAHLIGQIFYPGITVTTNSSTYSIFKNNVEVLNSARIILTGAQINLQSKLDVTQGDVIDIRWKVSAGEATLKQRILSLIRSN